MWKRLCGLFFAAAMACPLAAAAQTQNLEIDGDHGKLSAVIQRPDNQTKYPMVMLMHGFTGNKEQDLLTTIADNLEAQGIASIRFDFNGHGASEGAFQDMTVLNEIEDAKKVYAHCTAGVLRMKDAVLDQVTTLQENCTDIYEEAKAINEERAKKAEAAEV